MNSGGRVIAQGRYPAFECKIRPFSDRLDIEVPFLLYAVDTDAPPGPDTVFTDRFYEQRERWEPPGVGTIPGTEKAYFGPLPSKELRPVVGTDDQWLRGFSYAAYERGEYSSQGCCPCHPGPPVRIRQAQTIDCPTPYGTYLRQVQTAGTIPLAPFHQGQQMFAWGLIGPPPAFGQVQTVDAPGYVETAAPLGQVQTVGAPGTVEAYSPVAQAQAVGITGGLLADAPLSQAQQVDATAGPITIDGPVEQVQEVGGYVAGKSPGALSSTAADVDVGPDYLHGTDALLNQWWRWPAQSTGSYSAVFTIPDALTITAQVFEDSGSGLNYVGTGHGGDSVPVMLSATADVYVQVVRVATTRLYSVSLR